MYQTLPVGPYDVEIWYEPAVEIFKIKFKESTRATSFKEPDKKGCIFSITSECIKAGMKKTHEAGEFPQMGLMCRSDIDSKQSIEEDIMLQLMRIS